MHLPRCIFTALLCLALGPAVAQDGDGSGIEEDSTPPAGTPDDGYDPEATRKKNAGLAGGGEDEGDANAPKVKADLQTRINKAIEGGVEWLKKRQDKDGSWGPVRADTFYGDRSKKGDFARDELGPTAWAVYTLAKCGVKRSDPAIQNGLKWIAKNTEFVFDEIGGNPQKPDEKSQEQKNISKTNPRTLTTYESAAIVMMIEAVYEGSAKLTGKHSKRKFQTDNPAKPPPASKIPEEVWKAMHDRIVWLTVGRKIGGGGGRGKSVTTTIKGTQNIGEGGKNQGGWRYSQASGDADLSATQFVLLGLRAASQAGYPLERTSPKTWELAAQYVKNCQNGDGGFGYQVGGKSYASMTACGVGSLLICREQMALAVAAERVGDDKKAVPPPEWIDGAIAKGMEWLDKNFEADRNAGESERQEIFYYLYGVERVGDLTGRKEFNGKDWYTRGALLLLERQEADGKWQDQTGFRPHDVLGTTFALLFLKRATPPAVTYTD